MTVLINSVMVTSRNQLILSITTKYQSILSWSSVEINQLLLLLKTHPCPCFYYHVSSVIGYIKVDLTWKNHVTNINMKTLTINHENISYQSQKEPLSTTKKISINHEKNSINEVLFKLWVKSVSCCFSVRFQDSMNLFYVLKKENSVDFLIKSSVKSYSRLFTVLSC